MFESVVTVVFENIFCLEIHENDIFFIFKKLFLILVNENNLKI